MAETKEQLRDLKTDVSAIKVSVEELSKFKSVLAAESKVSASLRSTFISGVLGALTLALSLGVSIYLGKQERQAILEAAKIEMRGSHP